MSDAEFWIGVVVMLLVIGYAASRAVKDVYDYWHEGWDG